jgi:hypothetical protein
MLFVEYDAEDAGLRQALLGVPSAQDSREFKAEFAMKRLVKNRFFAAIQF